MPGIAGSRTCETPSIRSTCRPPTNPCSGRTLSGPPGACKTPRTENASGPRTETGPVGGPDRRARWYGGQDEAAPRPPAWVTFPWSPPVRTAHRRNRLAEPVLQCRDELTVRGVAAEFPEERTAQTLLLGVGHLSGDRGRSVVAPPFAAAAGVGGAADGSGGRAPGLQHLVVLDPGLIGAGGGPGRGSAGSVLGDAGPAPPVETDSQEQFAGRDSGALQLRDRGRGVESRVRCAGEVRQR